MQIVIPPRQSLANIAAYLSLSRAEATGLRDALELMLATGNSGWHAYICWGDYQTDVTLTLETDNPTGPTPLPDETRSS